MKTKSILSEFVVLLLLSLVPLPGPPVLRAPCPRDRSAVVRNIVNKKWIPILKQYGLKLPLECPFHPVRDIFWPRQVAKIRHRPSQWSCGLCGKSFYSEKFLEHHFENKHPDHLNMAEDAVCLADYCDIMRCAVWEAAATSKGGGGQASNTDLELWKQTNALVVSNSLSQPSPTALQSVPVAVSRGDITTYPSSNTANPSKSDKTKQRPPGPHCTSNTQNKKDSSNSLDGENSTLEEDQRSEDGRCSGSASTTGANSLNQMQRFKADCRPEQLLPLRTRCEGIVWDCIAGLLTNLSTEEFKNIEGEMNRAVCWYLTCDRYWENTPSERRRFPWALLLALVTGLALIICLCYYLIWLMCDSDEQGLVREGSMSQPSSPTMQARGMYSEEEAEYYADNLAAASAQGEHYIYVTYPPELKRRLMESCYNRTTRL